MAPETILVIDDHALFRSGLMSMLATAFGLEIIDSASMEDALASVAPVPAIVLLDTICPVSMASTG